MPLKWTQGFFPKYSDGPVVYPTPFGKISVLFSKKDWPKCLWRFAFLNFLQSCIKFKKFNSSSVHGIELSSQLKFSSFDKNWTWTAAQLTIELFWTEFKVNSERVECPLVEKRRNWAFSMSWHTKFCSSFPFLVGGTPLSLNWLWTQFKKVQWWVEQQFKFSFWPMNWTWIDHQVQGKNWIELRTSIQFWTAIQLCLIWRL